MSSDDFNSMFNVTIDESSAINSTSDLNSTNSTSGDTVACQLLGDFGYVIQGILGLLCFAVLVYKRFAENPKRTWKVWFFDSSKQLTSAGLSHLMNVIIAIFLSEHSNGKGDSCIWYFINIFIDSTLGMLICCFLVHMLGKLAESQNWRSMQSGLYFEFYVKDGKLKSRLRISMYVYQLLSWLFIVMLAKILLAIVQYNINGWLEVIGAAVLYPFRTNAKVKLIVVMVVFPVLMNSIQFWVTDNFLKLKKEVYPQLELPRNNQLQYENAEISNHQGIQNLGVFENMDKNQGGNPQIQIDFTHDNNDKHEIELQHHQEKLT